MVTSTYSNASHCSVVGQSNFGPSASALSKRIAQGVGVTVPSSASPGERSGGVLEQRWVERKAHLQRVEAGRADRRPLQPVVLAQQLERVISSSGRVAHRVVIMVILRKIECERKTVRAARAGNTVGRRYDQTTEVRLSSFCRGWRQEHPGSGEKVRFGDSWHLHFHVGAKLQTLQMLDQQSSEAIPACAVERVRAFP